MRKMSAKIGAKMGFKKKMSDASCADVFSIAIMWQTKPAAELMQQIYSSAGRAERGMFSKRGTSTKISSPTEPYSDAPAAVRPKSRSSTSSDAPKRKLRHVTAMPPKRGVRFLPNTL